MVTIQRTVPLHPCWQYNSLHSSEGHLKSFSFPHVLEPRWHHLPHHARQQIKYHDVWQSWKFTFALQKMTLLFCKRQVRYFDLSSALWWEEHDVWWQTRWWCTSSVQPRWSHTAFLRVEEIEGRVMFFFVTRRSADCAFSLIRADFF